MCSATLKSITTNNPPEIFAIDTSALFLIYAKVRPEALKDADPNKRQYAQHCYDFQRFWNAAINSPSPSIVFISSYVIQEYTHKLGGAKNVSKFYKILENTPSLINVPPSSKIYKRVGQLLTTYAGLDSNDAHIIAHAEEQNIKGFLVRDKLWHKIKGIEIFSHPDII